MARATARCTCKECGAEFTREKVLRNRKEADSWEAWASENIIQCPECWKREQDEERAKEETLRAEEREVAAANAERMNLPALSGTDKQVAWANVLRQNAIDLVEERVKDEHGPKIISYMIETKTKASEWIDNSRDIKRFIIKIIKEMENSPVDTSARKATEAESIIMPTDKTHPGEAKITIEENSVCAHYEKNEDFRCLVKSLGYLWDTNSASWRKKIRTTTGTAEERAAELGNKLLNAGFAVMIAEKSIRDAAVAGEYEPEHKRWILLRTSGEHAGKLAIFWPREDDLFDDAKKLPLAKWSNPNMVVPVSEWAAVVDFANAKDFKISSFAQEAIEEYKAKIQIVEPSAPKEKVYEEHDPSEVLNSGYDVIPDLQEDII